jgi:uncharacterized protein
MKNVLLAAMVLSVVGSAAAQPASAVEPPVVVISGEGVLKSAPDQAWVRIGAETRAKVAREAQAQNAAAMTAVQQRILSAGIPKDAIRTVALDLQMEYEYANGKQTPRGYVARNVIEVRVDDLAKVSEVVDSATGSGATSIHGLRFDVKNRGTLEREALQRAVADAMARAEAAAAGAKRTIDRVLRIEEGGERPSGPQPMMMTMRAAPDAAATPIAAGEIEIRASVTLTVSIK